VTVSFDSLDNLLRTLMQSRELEERIGVALREYSGATVSESRKRALEAQLQKIAQNNVQMMSRVQMLCSRQNRRDQAPEGYLGVNFSLSGRVKREKGGPDVYRFDEPPEIISVESGSPADRAGVRSGDHLLAIDGRDVVGRDVVFSQFLVPGRKLPMRVDRDGKEQALIVQVMKRPDGYGDQCSDVDMIMLPMRTPTVGAVAPVAPAAPRSFSFARTPAPRTAPDAPERPDPVANAWSFESPPPVMIAGFASAVAGAQLTTLTDDFKELTGADGGLMVQRVAPETPAAAAGLRGGDVIVEAGDREITSARLLQRLISDSESRSLKLKVVRRGKARVVWLKW
jgi:C-terminal processing protease CtpA/Prc